MRPALSLVPPSSPSARFDAARQAMLRAWQEAIRDLGPAEIADEIESTAKAMRGMAALHG